LFIKEHDQNITKSDLTELLRIATKNQLFQFQLNLYEQLDGVAMGSVQGPRMANAFTCKILKQLETEKQMPVKTASELLTTLNNTHPSIDFTIELEENCKLSFLGMEIIRNGYHLDTKVHMKPMDTGLIIRTM